jgi:hypothetical protein
MFKNGSEEGLLLVRAEPLGLAEEISQRMVDVVRVVDDALLLDTDLTWAGAINTVLVKKGVRVSELRSAQGGHSSPANDLKPHYPHKDDEEVISSGEGFSRGTRWRCPLRCSGSGREHPAGGELRAGALFNGQPQG